MPMCCPTLSELPPPPPHMAGWPWSEESPELPDTMPDGSFWPRISIITPSYNQGQFIEETIRSVLLQGYPDLEHIIIDGGSTDGSVNIIRKYEPWLAYWVSERDRGQSHAINKGLQKSSGEILAYLNSDDIYYPGAIRTAVETLIEVKSDIFIGGVDMVVIHHGKHELIKTATPHSGPRLHYFPIFSNGRMEDFQFIQPAMFWRRGIWQKVGMFNESYHYSMDREWFVRALAKDAVVQTTDNTLSRFTLHPGSKSQEFENRFNLDKAKMFARLSRSSDFRRIPTLLEALKFLVRYLQDMFYAYSKDYHEQGKRGRSLGMLMLGRLFRRFLLGLNGLVKYYEAKRS